MFFKKGVKIHGVFPPIAGVFTLKSWKFTVIFSSTQAAPLHAMKQFQVKCLLQTCAAAKASHHKKLCPTLLPSALMAGNQIVPEYRPGHHTTVPHHISVDTTRQTKTNQHKQSCFEPRAPTSSHKSMASSSLESISWFAEIPGAKSTKQKTTIACLKKFQIRLLQKNWLTSCKRALWQFLPS